MVFTNWRGKSFSVDGYWLINSKETPVACPDERGASASDHIRVTIQITYPPQSTQIKTAYLAAKVIHLRFRR
jgi:hypothetical protein